MKLWYKVIAADLVLLAALYFVLQDISWRTSYASSPHDACAGMCTYDPSFSYGLLTRVFTMTGNNARLVSPLTLDWVQVLAIVLVALNAWFAYVTLKSRSRGGVREPGSEAVTP
ncbi:MAG: hypothetical protein JRN06_01710 [Nitrososphaerota archaeon]|nr:hypothetical protein [Nitrososphaerota archaeon]MDG7023429.1 hypothetical protein [Nitrososphaerota archaeon]